MTQSKNLLDFVVIGAQKCATTWIYDCLKDHPNLNLRNSKNEDLYYGGPYYQTHGKEQWYFSQFKKQNNNLKGCISVEYIEDAQSPQVLKFHNPDIKIIASLRNPIDRCVSGYQWYVRNAFIPDLPVEEGLSNMTDHYKEKIRNNFSPMYCDIIERSTYSQKLKNYFTHFLPHQIKVVLYDDIKKDQLKTIQNIMRFLNIDSTFIPPNINTIPKKNTGFAPLIKIQRLLPESRIMRKFTDVSNQLLYKSNLIKPSSKGIDKKIRQELRAIFKPDIDNLKKILMINNHEVKNKLEAYWSEYNN